MKMAENDDRKQAMQKAQSMLEYFIAAYKHSNAEGVCSSHLFQTRCHTEAALMQQSDIEAMRAVKIVDASMAGTIALEMNVGHESSNGTRRDAHRSNRHAVLQLLIRRHQAGTLHGGAIALLFSVDMSPAYTETAG